MTVTNAHNPAYLSKLSCMAASLANDPQILGLTSDSYAYWNPKDDEQREMMKDLAAMARASCPQRFLKTPDVSNALKQYAQITGMAAAQMMASSPTGEIR